MKHTIISVIMLLLLLVANGCGSGNQQLTGTVTYSDDGSPVKAGMVVLTSEGKSGRGDIGPDGKFTIGFESEKNGIPKGKTYTVTIVNAQEETGLDKSGMPIMTQLIDQKYSNAATSGFTFTSDGSTKALDLKVDRFKK